MPNGRTINVIALAGVMLLLGLAPGQTEDYPSRPVRLIITTPAGSLVDVLGRLFAQDLSDRLGQTIVVDNRPGAMTGADFVHVPYRGGGQAASDAVAGQIEMVSLGLASARVAEGGALRVLAQTGPRRHPMFADVPTTAELGMPDVRMDTWFGLLAPPDTPEPIVARLVRESDAVVNQPGFREKLFRIGCDAAWMPPTEFGIFMRDDAKKWEKLIPAMGIPMVD